MGDFAGRKVAFRKGDGTVERTFDPQELSDQLNRMIRTTTHAGRLPELRDIPAFFNRQAVLADLKENFFVPQSGQSLFQKIKSHFTKR